MRSFLPMGTLWIERRQKVKKKELDDVKGFLSKKGTQNTLLCYEKKSIKLDFTSQSGTKRSKQLHISPFHRMQFAIVQRATILQSSGSSSNWRVLLNNVKWVLVCSRQNIHHIFSVIETRIIGGVELPNRILTKAISDQKIVGQIAREFAKASF